MSVGQGAVSIVGEVTTASSRKSSNFALTQSMDSIEVKAGLELTIPPGASADLPFSFASGVTEALFLALYSPNNLTLRVTSSDGATPGPVVFGVKGYWVQTFSIGKGVTAVHVTNPSTTKSVTLDFTYASKADAADAPTYWND